MNKSENQHFHKHVLENGTVVEHTHEHEHGHGHTHSHTHTKAVINRLSRAIGHLPSTTQGRLYFRTTLNTVL